MGRLLDLARQAADERTTAPGTNVAATTSGIRPSVTDPSVALLDAAAEVRHKRVLAVLDGRPDIRHHVVVDNPDTDPVRLMVGIRNLATFEVEIPKSRYDLKLLLDLIQRHGATLH